ncbi:MAG: hypothetical protein JRF63_07145 [Deltaproteobacteria bacterium]|nr:hypothetical protein [Deltaproteobacteria bacterium]
MNARSIAMAALLGLCALASKAEAEPPGEVAESDTYTIRIFYDISMVDDVPLMMAEAEAAWVDLVEGHQLSPPLTMFGDVVDVGFDVLLDTEIPGVGTYEVLGDSPDTAITDCPTLAWFNPWAAPTEEMLTMTMHHLLARQCLRAVDCIEPYKPAYDMFAVAYGYYYMGLDHPYWLSSELPAFQSMPWKSLDYVGASSDMDDVFYAYGSALFALFLDEVYGAGDGALLNSTWDRTAQDGTILTWTGPFATADVENEPDFLDAIAAELEEQSSSFDEAFLEFVEWRYFLGADDDGAHSPSAADWTGGEVTRDILLAADDLPVEDKGCENRVAEYGSNYIEIDVTALDPEVSLDFEFDGNPETSWWAGLFLIPEDGAATVQPFEMGDEFSGETSVGDPTAFSQIVIAVANLSDGEHDGDAEQWGTATGDFTYSITGPAGSDSDTDVDSDTDSDSDSDTDSDAGAEPTGSSNDGGCSCRAVDETSDVSLLALLTDTFM